MCKAHYACTDEIGFVSHLRKTGVEFSAVISADVRRAFVLTRFNR